MNSKPAIHELAFTHNKVLIAVFPDFEKYYVRVPLSHGIILRRDHSARAAPAGSEVYHDKLAAANLHSRREATETIRLGLFVF